MKKKIIIIGLTICILITGLYGYQYYQRYYDLYIDLENSEVSGLNTSHTIKASSELTDTITITYGRGRTLELQKYDDDQEAWITMSTYELEDTDDEQEVTLEYSDWNDTNNSLWRLYIPEDDMTEAYTSENIYVYTTNRESVSLKASSAIIMEVDTKQIYYQKDIDTQRSIASTTKLLTALVALEYADLDDEVRVTSEAVTTHNAHIHGVGDKITMKDLLYYALMASDNGAAVAIAQHAGGSLSEFKDLVNEWLEEHGYENTSFTNPAGFSNKNHYSTARELALISIEAYNNETIRKIVKKKKYSFTTEKYKYTYSFSNTNKLLGEVDGVTGMKTGTTYAAGKCLVTSYEYNNSSYIIVVLGSTENGRWTDTKNLIKYIKEYA